MSPNVICQLTKLIKILDEESLGPVVVQHSRLGLVARHVVQRILFLMSMFFRCLSALVWLCATQCTTFSPDCISPLFNIRCVFDDKILKDDFCQFFIKI